MHRVYETPEAALQRAKELVKLHRIPFSVWWREEDNVYLVMPDGWEPVSIRHWRQEEVVRPTATA